MVELAAAVSLSWNVMLVATFQFTSTVQASSPAFTVMTYSVLTENKRRMQVIEHILKLDADIVYLPEVDMRWQRELEPFRHRLLYAVAIEQQAHAVLRRRRHP